jgi:hypothetical protein
MLTFCNRFRPHKSSKLLHFVFTKPSNGIQKKNTLSMVALSPNARWNIQDDHAHITTHMLNTIFLRKSVKKKSYETFESLI